MLRHVSLFAGVDAIGIAAEQHGYTTVAAVDNDPFCQSVLRVRRPNATIYSDVRDVGVRELGTDIDLMSGGSPCQDLSTAGKGAGLRGDRSGLIFEFLRIISECRPRAVLIENVAVLRSRGLDVVLDGLASIGYGAWWDVVPALAVGAPHLRERIWITAVPAESMPVLSSFPAKALWTERPKMPRSGYMLHGFVDELEPQATQAMCKAAMGAVKDGGTTWLTAIDSPLFPTPSASTYGSNRGGAAVRSVPPRHSLTSMAKSGMWPTPTTSMWKGAGPLDRRAPCDDDLPTRVARMWPTAEKSDGTGGRISAELGGLRPSGAKRAVTLATAVHHHARLWPTVERPDGRSGARDIAAP